MERRRHAYKSRLMRQQLLQVNLVVAITMTFAEGLVLLGREGARANL